MKNRKMEKKRINNIQHLNEFPKYRQVPARTIVLEKTLESPLDSKEIKPVNPKGNQPWIFVGRTDGWSLNSNTLATWANSLKKTLVLGKTEGRRRRRQMVGWHHWLTQWTWVWANSERWWKTKKPGLWQSTGSQRVRSDIAAKPQHYFSSFLLSKTP